MDQQEFAPRSQSPQGSQDSQAEEQQPLEAEEVEYPAQPYYWSSKPNTPKDEPTSLYDVPMVQNDTLNDYQNGYMARETVEEASQSGEKIDTRQSQEQGQ